MVDPAASPASDPQALVRAAGLARNPVFEALSEPARLRLAGHGSVVDLPAGASICAAGETADAAYVVLRGEVEIALSRSDGGEVWLARFGAGRMVGEIALLDGGPRSADITAATSVRLLRLSRDAVMQALLAEPAAALKLLAHLAGLLRQTNRQVEAATALTLEVRLARLLLESASDLTARSQAEIARSVGAARESVNRRLAHWRRDGLITVTPQGVRVLDRRGLMRAAEMPDAAGAP